MRPPATPELTRQVRRRHLVDRPRAAARAALLWPRARATRRTSMLTSMTSCVPSEPGGSGQHETRCRRRQCQRVVAAQHVSCERAELKAREEKVLESANATYYVALKTISLTYFHEFRSGAPVAAPRAGRSGQRQVARAVRVRQGARGHAAQHGPEHSAQPRPDPPSRGCRSRFFDPAPYVRRSRRPRSLPALKGRSQTEDLGFKEILRRIYFKVCMLGSIPQLLVCCCLGQTLVQA